MKFKCIPGCSHLFVIQQCMCFVYSQSNSIRCFGGLVSFISVCHIIFTATSVGTCRLNKFGGQGPHLGKWTSNWWNDTKESEEAGKHSKINVLILQNKEGWISSKTKRMEVLMRCRKLSWVFLWNKYSLIFLFFPPPLCNCQNAIVDPRFCLYSHELLRYLAWLDHRSFVLKARGLLLDLNLHLLETISVLAVC